MQNILTEQLNNKLKAYWKLFICIYAFSVVFYILFITQQLTNTFDGLWHDSYYTAGWLEFSTGRWVLPYMDRLHLGMQVEPVASCLTIGLILLAVILIIDMLKLRGPLAYIAAAYIMTNTIVTCILSYRFTAISYGLGVLLGAAAAWLLMQDYMGRLRYLLSLICLIGCLGIYQANIAVAAVLMVFIFIRMIMESRDRKELISFALSCVALMILACILYRVIALLHMWVFNVSASDYKGADSLSVAGMITSLPRSIAKCYDAFYRYFLTDGFVFYNIFQRFGPFKYVFSGSMILIALIRLFGLLRKKDITGLILAALALLVLPIASNMALLFATEAGVMIQMTFAMAIIFPCMLSLAGDALYIDAAAFKDKAIRHLIVPLGVLLLTVFITWGNALQSSRDINAMYEGRNATRALVDRVIDELIREDMLLSDKEYAFIGRPADNELMFHTTDMFGRCNSYARFGEFWTGADCMRMSYQAMLLDCSADLKLVEDTVYDSMRVMPEVKDMPAFPEEGSIEEVDGIIVVKVAEVK